MTDRGAWCIGTPDDLIETINRLDEDSGGFGGVLIQAQEWGTREQVDHSDELVARYVAPRFRGSMESLEASQTWSAAKRTELDELRRRSLERAQVDTSRGANSPPSTVRRLPLDGPAARMLMCCGRGAAVIISSFRGVSAEQLRAFALGT